MLLISLHIVCFTKLLRTVLYSKHINSFLFLKFIKRKAPDNYIQVFVTQYVSHELLDFESRALFFVSSWSVNLIRVFSMMIHCIS